MKMCGILVDGLGIGKKKVRLLCDKLGRRRLSEIFQLENLFPGTLNIQLNEPWLVTGGFSIAREEYGGDGDVTVLPCRVNDSYSACIVRPEATIHDMTIIELVSHVKLRDVLCLHTGDCVCIEV